MKLPSLCAVLLLGVCRPSPLMAGGGPIPGLESQAGAKAGSPPPYLVLIDAAHGGSDQGARLTDHLLEKDLTLSMSSRLRAALNARGIAVVMTRESDVALSARDRTKVAGHAQAVACILLHATASGTGVHLFTSSLTPTPPSPTAATAPRVPRPAPSEPESTAQAASVLQSARLTAEVDAALIRAEVPVTLGRTSLQPLDSLPCPAVAVELAPFRNTSLARGAPISDAAYQAKIIAALADALQRWREDAGLGGYPAPPQTGAQTGPRHSP